MVEQQTHGKAMREVKDTSFMRGPMEKRFYVLAGSQDSPLRPSDKSNTKM
jgi:hypothetical protein